LSDSERADRHNTGKDRWDLLPWDALRYLTRVYGYGARKYSDRNWEKGMPWSECFASLQRHYNSRSWGQQKDVESQLLHTAHAAWNALALLAYEIRGVGEDDFAALFGSNREREEDSDE
jgi:dATP/dGTP diphosphohydrolase, N-terminal